MSSIVHCGACGTLFSTVGELVEHLKTCDSALLGRSIIEKAIADNLEPAYEKGIRHHDCRNHEKLGIGTQGPEGE